MSRKTNAIQRNNRRIKRGLSWKEEFNCYRVTNGVSYTESARINPAVRKHIQKSILIEIIS